MSRNRRRMMAASNAVVSYIYYTTTNGLPLSGGTFETDAELISNTYKDGQGILKYIGEATIIKDNAFIYQNTLQSIVVPDTIRTIGSYAFSSCTHLVSVIIPEGGTTINDYAFNSCDALLDVTIPSTVTYLGTGAFRRCPIGRLTINSKSLVEYDYSSNYYLSSYVFNNNKITEIILPKDIERVGNFAFTSMPYLLSITIPDGVKALGNYSFNSCNALEFVSIPDSVTSFGTGAFRYCSSLKNFINNRETPQSIRSNVFSNVNIANCTLYVPAESVAAYQAAAVWKTFGSILPIPTT